MNKDLQEFYRSVDSRARSLEQVHAGRLNCGKGCSSCCVDGITVFRVEAENIEEKHGDLLADREPHAAGACAFLDGSGGCRIYEDRPYVCRTQGLPLRWLEEVSGGIVEYRDICPLNESDSERLETIDEDKCWSIGEFEGRLASIEAAASESKRERVSLRSLFKGE